MIYCVSDLHGCYDKYIRMIEKINLQGSDTLYILGDCVDRGPRSMEILLDIVSRKNVVLICGNHDYHAASLLQWLGKPLQKGVTQEDLIMAFNAWFSGNGGGPTFEGFRLLSQQNREIVLNLIRHAPNSIRIEIGGQRFLLAHTVPEYEKWVSGCEERDFLEGEPDYEIQYDKDLILVTGHTPTGLIDPTSKGKIWHGNNHIAIDCGAVFGNPLGCICLDTMEEFYVE